MSTTLFDSVTGALTKAGVEWDGKTWGEILKLYAQLDLPPYIRGDTDWDAFESEGIGDT